MTEPRIAHYVEQPTAVVRETVPREGIADFLSRALGAVARALEEQGLQPVGPPVAKYYGPATEPFDVEVGFPVAQAPQPSGSVIAGALPGGRIAETTHVGRYEELGDAYAALRKLLAAQGLTPGLVAWEVYVDDPMSNPDPSTLRTQVCWTIDDDGVD